MCPTIIFKVAQKVERRQRESDRNNFTGKIVQRSFLTIYCARYCIIVMKDSSSKC